MRSKITLSERGLKVDVGLGEFNGRIKIGDLQKEANEHSKGRFKYIPRSWKPS